MVALPDCAPLAPSEYAPAGALALGPCQVAFSRTDARGPQDEVREVEALLVDAIHAAEQLIYIETQYFSSRSIAEALITRMQQPGRPRLEIVVVLNDKPEAVKEEPAIGLRQAKILTRLARVARETGHALGVYGSLCDGEAPDRPYTYIHSKLLSVDDRFLTVGSANLTNRSMGVDTELNVSWEAPSGREPLIESIRALRVSLLAEHTGVTGADFGTASGLVERLDQLSAAENARLKKHVMATEREQDVMKLVDPEDLPFDPTQPDYGDSAPEPEDEQHSRSRFVEGLSALRERWKAMR
jgi:phosphatidylserine/phosphatidylglycerophosphate/cardiolipin synthase-like enzyme